VSQASAAPPPTVLAVDDDPIVRESLRLVLEDYYAVVLAADGLEALETLRSRRVDVVLLDLRMEHMDGRDALVHIRQRHPRTPVIVVSGVDDLPTVVRCMQLGAWNYVVKPWEEDTLIALVRAAVREGRDEPGVLLISDDVAALAPLHLALERQMRVFETNVVGALRSTFRPTAIVLDSFSARMRPHDTGLQERFPGTSFFFVRALDHALTLLAEHGVISRQPQRNAPVTTAIEFICGHYAEPLTVGAVATAVSLSAGRLAHIFAETTGFSVKEYVARIRVNIARRFLAESTDTLETIADRLGFPDASNFSRTFKSVGGIAPGEFRRSLQRGH
jgi:two-component system, response regulator YesN